jgi:hypothetical protein
VAAVEQWTCSKCDALNEMSSPTCWNCEATVTEAMRPNPASGQHKLVFVESRQGHTLACLMLRHAYYVSPPRLLIPLARPPGLCTSLSL